MNSRSIRTPEDADDDRREDQGTPIGDAEVREQHPGTEGAHHVLGAVREVDDVHQAKDDGEPQRQQRIERAVDETQQQLAKQRLRRHADQLEHGAVVSLLQAPGPGRQPSPARDLCAYYLTSGHSPSSSGRNASAAGMVARIL